MKFFIVKLILLCISMITVAEDWLVNKERDTSAALFVLIKIFIHSNARFKA